MTDRKKTTLGLVAGVALLAAVPLMADPFPNQQPARAGVSDKQLVDYSNLAGTGTNGCDAATIAAQNGYVPSFCEDLHVGRVDSPYASLTPRLTWQLPLHVDPHSRDVLDDIEDRPFFDYFSWQSFVGLMWPAAPDPDNKGAWLRGVADTSVSSKADFQAAWRPGKLTKQPAVFETFRTGPELLPGKKGGPEPAPPPEWAASSFERPLGLEMMTKGDFSTLDEAFSNPLLDQSGNYVRYSVQVNEVLYEYVRINGYYLKANLPKSPSVAELPPVTGLVNDPTSTQQYVALDGTTKALKDVGYSDLQMQTGTYAVEEVYGNSITLKAAWKRLDGATTKELERYYTTTADIVVPAYTETVSRPGKPARTKTIPAQSLQGVTVGLVGLHIVVKTSQFKQGIWASFEHIDNVRANDGFGPSFNDGNPGSDAIDHGFSSIPPKIDPTAPAKKPDPPQVTRVWKIPDTPVASGGGFTEGINGLSTVGMNKTYADLLDGTVWANYELVITQWPTDPGSFYAKPFLAPRGVKKKDLASDVPKAMTQIYDRSALTQAEAYPRWAALPIPQVGALNTTMETYFQNPPADKKTGEFQPLENTSCMGCHYGASDMDFFYGLKLHTWPHESGFDQGRINPVDGECTSDVRNTDCVSQ